MTLIQFRNPGLGMSEVSMTTYATCGNCSHQFVVDVSEIPGFSYTPYDDDDLEIELESLIKEVENGRGQDST